MVVEPSGGTDDEPGLTLVGMTGVVVPEGAGVSVGTGVEEAGVSEGEVSTGGTSEELSVGTDPVSVGVTGHQVVETRTVEVVTEVESAGQSVTVSAHCVMVTSLVL